MASASGESENLDEGDTIDRAVQQFIERQQAGEMIDLEQFCRPYGARAAELRILLEEFLGIESALRAPQRAEETVQVSGASWDDPNWGRYVSQLRSRGPASRSRPRARSRRVASVSLGRDPSALPGYRPAGARRFTVGDRSARMAA